VTKNLTTLFEALQYHMQQLDGVIVTNAKTGI
jgi:hypothetical protein